MMPIIQMMPKIITGPVSPRFNEKNEIEILVTRSSCLVTAKVDGHADVFNLDIDEILRLRGI